MSAPLFSIIIPTFNSGPKLGRTVESVLTQNFDAFEVLIIDGCSTDETAELLRGYANERRIRSVSEPDDGVYDAMNKGIRLAKARFLYFLGSGDILRPGVLSRIAARLPKPGCTFLYGNVWFPDTRVVYDGPFTRGKLRRINICHQAIFYERSIFDVLGTYETKYPYLADWGFNMKCFGDRSIRKMYVDEVVSDYEGRGVSMTQLDKGWGEDYGLMIRRHLGPVQYFLHTAEPRIATWRTRLQAPLWRVRNRLALRRRINGLLQRMRVLLNLCR